MNTNFRLSKITIDNFRGIKHVEVDLDRDVTVLIGENNTGKTSILEALRLCLDTIKSDKICNFSEFDFYRDGLDNDLSSCQDICITLSFFESEESPWSEYIIQRLNEVIVGSEYSIIKLRVMAGYDADIGEHTQSWCFLDEADNEIRGREGMIKELRHLRPFFFLPALRTAKEQFSGQSTYWASFLKNKDINDATRQELEEELSQINQKIVDAHPSFNDVTEEVKRVSDFFVTVRQTDAVTVDPIPTDAYKVLRHTHMSLLTASGAKLPIHSHGEGTQSLSVLLLFMAYLKTRLQADIDGQAEPIIAIEEPEAHLHPNAVRAMWSLLDKLPGQKIVATHSGDILSEVLVQRLRRINRKDNTTDCKAIPNELLLDNKMRLFNHHVRRNRGELLFARCWLMVEGETDVSVFAECAAILGIDLHRKGVRIVECSQAGGTDIFIKVADALGIHWHLVADNDDGGQTYIQSAKNLLEGRPEREHISLLNYRNMDVLLCYCGYGEPYRDGVGRQKEAELEELEIDSIEYWEKIYEIICNKRGFSKPEAALRSIFDMKTAGPGGVPGELKDILDRVISLGEPNP